MHHLTWCLLLLLGALTVHARGKGNHHHHRNKEDKKGEDLENLVYHLQEQVDALLLRQRTDRITIHNLQQRVSHLQNVEYQPTLVEDNLQEPQLPTTSPSTTPLDSTSSSTPSTQSTLATPPTGLSEEEEVEEEGQGGLGSRWTLKELEEERKVLRQLEEEVRSLRVTLREAVGLKEREMQVEDDQEEIKNELDYIRSELKSLKSQISAQESKTKGDQNTARREHLTSTWMVDNLKQVQANLVDLQEAFNVSKALHDKQETESHMQLLLKDVAELQKGLTGLESRIVSAEATAEVLQQETSQAARTAHHNTATIVANQERMNSLQSEWSDLLSLLPEKVSTASSTTSGHQHLPDEEQRDDPMEEADPPRGHRDHRRQHHSTRMEVVHLKEQLSASTATQKVVLQRLRKMEEMVESLDFALRHVQQDVALLKASTSSSSTSSSTSDNLEDDLKTSQKKRLDALEETTILLEKHLGEIESSVKGLGDMHSSSMQLFHAVEELEDHLDSSVTEVRKEVAKLEFSLSQISSEQDVLKEEQKESYVLIKSLRKDTVHAKHNLDLLNLKMATLETEALNLTLQDCKANNEEETQRIRFNETRTHFRALEQQLRAHRAEVETVVRALEGQVDLKGLMENVETSGYPHDCSDPGLRTSTDVAMIRLRSSSAPVQVKCSDSWTVIMRRNSPHLDFFRTWNEYEQGFGLASDEYWAGLSTLNKLTTSRPMTIKFSMETTEGEIFEANYEHVRVSGPEDGYRLHLSGYYGNASDAMRYHSAMRFSTWDRDQDATETNCAEFYRGGWWFNACIHANLNGDYANGLSWFRDEDRHWLQLSSVEVMLRPADYASTRQEDR
ncbi:scabrous [Oratosquilla oratoria]|uniref:scabrous n=1 Tax=Oratosquilla oratoria TaxID=337810 RepID=UPI003F75EC1F